MNSYYISRKLHEMNRPLRTGLLLRSAGLGALALAMTATVPTLAGGFSNAGKMNLARSGQAAMLLADGQVLELGGNNSLAAEQSADLYNPATGKWTLIGNLNPRGIFGYSAVLLPDREVLVAGGRALGGPMTNSAALFNPSTGTWTPTTSMSTAREGCLLILLSNGKALAAGGDTNFSEPSTAELYDPATRTWTPTGSMTGSFNGYTAILLGGGEVLALVAEVSGGATDLYDPATGSWTANPPPPPALSGLVGLLPDGLAWGADILYDASTAQWTTFAGPSSRGGVCVLATGQGLAAGGTFEVKARPYPIEETLKSAELWDPRTLAWTSIANLNVSRTGQSMTLLLNGQVLLAGGESFDKSAGALVPIASAELYTP